MITKRIEEVKNVVSNIKSNKENWKMSFRRKIREFLINIGMDDTEVFDLVYKHLTFMNCISGPESDNHNDGRFPGDIWKFGLSIMEIECYLKVQLKPDNSDYWISIHPAEHPLKYEFK